MPKMKSVTTGTRPAGALWHCTDWRGFRGILKTEEIRPNRGEFRFRSGLSPMGCSHRMGAISLFMDQVDLGKGFLGVWMTNYRPVTFAFMLDAARLHGGIVNPAETRPRPPGITVRGEVCHIGPISWDAVLGCLFVRAANPECRVYVAADRLDGVNINEAMQRLRAGAGRREENSCSAKE